MITEDSDGDIQIKLIDFGLAKQLHKIDEKMTSFCGSLFYLSPEALAGSYTINCDLWSVGIITYCLLTGIFPYYAKNKEKMKL